MPVYKFKFGEITIAEGLPPVTPEIQAWCEREADRLLGDAMRTVVNNLLTQLQAQAPMAPIVVPPRLEQLTTVQISGLSATQLSPVKPPAAETPPLQLQAKRISDGAMVLFTGKDLGVVDGFYQSLFVIDGRELVHEVPVTALAAAPRIPDARMALDLEFLRMVAGLDPETLEVL